MAMSLNSALRQQSTATVFPARRSSDRGSGLSSPFVRRASRHHSVVVSGEASMLFGGVEPQRLVAASAGVAAVELLDGVSCLSAPANESGLAGACYAAPFQLAAAPFELAALDEEEDDEDEDLDEDDDLLDDEDDEDLDDEDDEDEDEDDEDDYEDLDEEEDDDEDDE